MTEPTDVTFEQMYDWWYAKNPNTAVLYTRAKIIEKYRAAHPLRATAESVRDELLERACSSGFALPHEPRLEFEATWQEETVLRLALHEVADLRNRPAFDVEGAAREIVNDYRGQNGPLSPDRVAAILRRFAGGGE